MVELDINECYVVNPYLFISKTSGEYMKKEVDRTMFSLIPKQFPPGLDEETVK